MPDPALASLPRLKTPGARLRRLVDEYDVIVADASVLPTCPEVNPQLSVMAMALSVADPVKEHAGAR